MATKNNRVNTTYHNLNSPWYANTLKSLGMGGVSMIKDMVPVTYDLGSNSRQAASDLSRSIRSNKGTGTRVITAIKNNPYVKTGETFFKNAIDDIRTGNLVNTERKNKMMDEQTDAMFGDMDVMLDDLDNYADGDEDTNVSRSDNSIGLSLMNLSESVGKQTEYQLKASKAHTDAVISIASTSMMRTNEIGSQMVSELQKINSNLAALIQYNTENMTKFIDASIGYYGQMNNYMDKTISDDGIDDLTSSNGGFNVSAYGKYVKNQAKNKMNESAVGSTFSMILENPSMFLGSPLEGVTKFATKALIPKAIQSSLKMFDKTLEDFIPGMLEKIAEVGEEHAYGTTLYDKAISTIGGILGVKTKRKDSFDTNGINKGPMSWNGVANHTVTEIIPKYLRESTSYLKEIAEAVSGKSSKDMKNSSEAFDWENGRYRSLKEIKDNIYGSIKDEIVNTMNMSDFGQAMQNKGRLLDNDEDRAMYAEGLEKLYVAMENLGRQFHANNADEREKLLKSLDINDELKKYLDASLSTLTEQQQMNAITASQKARRARNRRIREFESRPGENNLYAAVSDERIDDGSIDASIDELYNIKKNQSNIVVIGPNNKARNKSTDKVSVKDYLSDIRMLLTRGINVSIVKSLPNIDDLSIRDNINSNNNVIDATQVFNQDQSEAHVSSNVIKAESRFSSNSNKSAEDYAEEIKNNEYNYEEVPNGKITRGVTKGISKANNVMYSLLMGRSDQAFEELKASMINKLTKAKDYVNENFFTPIKENLFGKKNGNGYRDGGIIGEASNSMREMFFKFRRSLNGKGYIDKNGKTVNDMTDEEAREYSVSGKLKGVMSDISAGIKEKLFGFTDKDGNDHDGAIKKTKGAIISGMETLKNGITGWSVALFGKTDKDGNISDEEKKKAVDMFKDKAAKMFPSAIAGGIIGGVGGSVTGGLLGTIVGGPITGVILGSASGMLKQSDTFKNWLFGKELDPEHPEKGRLGGAISRQTQLFMKKNKKMIVGGAALGAVKGAFTGGGALGMLVGGPVAGALLGTASSLVVSSGSFKQFLFGKGERGQEGYRAGILGGFRDMFNKSGKKSKSDSKVLGMNILGVGAGALAGGALAKAGLLGSFLSPLGPVGGALIGLAASVQASSGGFKKWLFGEDIDPNDPSKGKTGGILRHLGNRLTAYIIKPFESAGKWFIRDAQDFIKDKILAPVEFAVKPLTQGMANIKDSVERKIGDIKDAFINKVVEPIQKATLQYVVNPMRKVFGGIFKVLWGMTKSTIAMPFKLLGMAAGFTGSRNKSRSLKQYRRDENTTLGQRLLSYIPGTNARKEGQWAYNEDRDDHFNAQADYEAERTSRTLRKKFDRKREKRENDNIRFITKWTNGDYVEDTEDARKAAYINYRKKKGFLRTERYKIWVERNFKDGSKYDLDDKKASAKIDKAYDKYAKTVGKRGKQTYYDLDEDDKKVTYKKSGKYYNAYDRSDDGSLNYTGRITQDEFNELSKSKKLKRRDISGQTQLSRQDFINKYFNYEAQDADPDLQEYLASQKDSEKNEEEQTGEVKKSNKFLSGIKNILEEMYMHLTGKRFKPKAGKSDNNEDNSDTAEILDNFNNETSDETNEIGESVNKSGKRFKPEADKSDNNEDNSDTAEILDNETTDETNEISESVNKLGKRFKNLFGGHKHAKGTNNAPSGASIIGEEGPEILIDNKGNSRIVGLQNQLVDMKGGEKVIPNNNIDSLSATSTKSDTQISRASNRTKLSIGERLLSALMYLNYNITGKTPSDSKFNYIKQNVKNRITNSLVGRTVSGAIKRGRNIINDTRERIGIAREKFNDVKDFTNETASIISAQRLLNHGKGVKGFFNGAGNVVKGFKNQISDLGFAKEMNSVKSSDLTAENINSITDEDMEGMSEEQADRIRNKKEELQANADQEKVSGKTADAMKAKRDEEKQKEADEENKTATLATLKSTEKATKDHAFKWSSIFGKKGLITLALLTIGPKILKNIGGIIDFAKPILTGIYNVTKKVGGWLFGVGSKIWDSVSGIATNIGNFVGNFISNDVLPDLQFGIKNLGSNKDSGDKIIENGEEVISLVADGDVAGFIGNDHMTNSKLNFFNQKVTKAEAQKISKAGGEAALQRLSAKSYLKSSKIQTELANAYADDALKAVNTGWFGSSANTSLMEKLGGKITKLDASAAKSTTKAEAMALKAAKSDAKIAGKKITKTAAKEAADATLVNIMEKNNDGLKGKCIELLKSGFSKILKLAKEKFPGIALSESDNILSKVIKCVSSKFKNIAGKVSKLFAATAGLAATGIGLLAKEATWVTLGAVNGLTGAAKLFQIDSDKVDNPTMTIIAGIFGALSGTTIGSVIDIVNELTVDIIGFDFIHEFAVLIYKAWCSLTGRQQKISAYDMAKNDFKNRYLDYVEDETKNQYETLKSIGNIAENTSYDEFKQMVNEGEITVATKSYADYNDDQHQSAADKVRHGLGAIGGGIKKGWGFLFGSNETYSTDANGNKYTKNSDGTYQVTVANGNDLGKIDKSQLPATSKETTTHKSGIIGNGFKALGKLGSSINSSIQTFFFGKTERIFLETNGSGAYYKQNGDSFDYYNTNDDKCGEGVCDKDTIEAMVMAGELTPTVRKVKESGISTIGNAIKNSAPAKFIGNTINTLKDIRKNATNKVAENMKKVTDFISNNKVVNYFKKNKEVVYFDENGNYYKLNSDNSYDYYNNHGDILAENVPEDDVNNLRNTGMLVESTIDGESQISIDIKNNINNIREGVKSAFDTVANKVNEVFSTVGSFASTVIEKAGNFITNNKIVNYFKKTSKTAYYDMNGCYYVKKDDTTYTKYNANNDIIGYASASEVEDMISSGLLTEGTIETSGAKDTVKGIKKSVKDLWNKAKSTWDKGVGFVANALGLGSTSSEGGGSGASIVTGGSGTKTLSSGYGFGGRGSKRGKSNATVNGLNKTIHSGNGIGKTAINILKGMFTGDNSALEKEEKEEYAKYHNGETDNNSFKIAVKYAAMMSEDVAESEGISKDDMPSENDIKEYLRETYGFSNDEINTAIRKYKNNENGVPKPLIDTFVKNIAAGKASIDMSLSSDALHKYVSRTNVGNIQISNISKTTNEDGEYIDPQYEGLYEDMESAENILNGTDTAEISTQKQSRWSQSILDDIKNGRIEDYYHNFAELKQDDSRWADKTYGNMTLGTSGCGPTAYAMVVNSLKGKRYFPNEIAARADELNEITDKGAMDSDFFGKAKSDYGITPSAFSVKNRNGLLSELKQDHPVILLGSSGDANSPFTNEGHYIVATGYTDNGEKLIINNPLGTGRSGIFDTNTILNQASSKGWSFKNSGQPSMEESTDTSSLYSMPKFASNSDYPTSTEAYAENEFSDAYTASTIEVSDTIKKKKGFFETLTDFFTSFANNALNRAATGEFDSPTLEKDEYSSSSLEKDEYSSLFQNKSDYDAYKANMTYEPSSVDEISDEGGNGGRGGKSTTDTLNGFKYYSQNDEKWANTDYSINGDISNIGESGCGPTAMSMVASSITGRNIDPTQTASLARATGDRDETGTNWSFINKASDIYGINATSQYNPSSAFVDSELSTGHPMILSGTDNSSDTPYTSSGHYVVAVGKDSNGNVIINDPSGRETSGKYKLNKLIGKTGAAWAFDTKGNNTASLIKNKLGGFGKRTVARIMSKGGRGDMNWMTVVKTVKKLMAAQSHEYNSSTHTEIDINGDVYQIRDDCSGYVSACLYYYGVFGNKKDVTNSTQMLDASSGTSEALVNAGFTQRSFTNWDELQEGDILVRAGHTEIFGHNEGSNHFVYNAGSTEAIASPGESHYAYDTYTAVWSPPENAEGNALYNGSASVSSNVGNNIIGYDEKLKDGYIEKDGKYYKENHHYNAMETIKSFFDTYVDNVQKAAIIGDDFSLDKYGFEDLYNDKEVSKSEAYEKVPIYGNNTTSQSTMKNYASIADADLNKLTSDTLRYSDIKTIPHLSQNQIDSALDNAFADHAGSVYTEENSDEASVGIFNAQEETGLSSIIPLAIGALESGWGVYPLGKNKSNLWGWTAYNSDPSGSATTFGDDSYSAFKDYTCKLLDTYYDNYGAKSINSIGTGDNPKNMGYAYDDDGKISTTWAPNVTSCGMRIVDKAKIGGGGGRGTRKGMSVVGYGNGKRSAKQITAINSGRGNCKSCDNVISLQSISRPVSTATGITFGGGHGEIEPASNVQQIYRNISQSNSDLSNAINKLQLARSSNADSGTVEKLMQTVISLLQSISSNTLSSADKLELLKSLSTKESTTNMMGGTTVNNYNINNQNGGKGDTKINKPKSYSSQAKDPNAELARKIAFGL